MTNQTMRRLFRVVLILMFMVGFTSAPHVEADQLDVYQTKKARRQASQMLEAYQRAKGVRAMAERRTKVQALDSAAAIRERARKARQANIQAMGGLPQNKCPLKARVTGSLEREDFLIKKVLFQSRPNFWVSGHLYLPKPLPEDKMPGILAPMGHTSAGKAAPWLQQRCIGLVRQGYAVFTYDQIGLGERWQYWDAKSNLSPIGYRNPMTNAFETKRNRTTMGHTYLGNPLWLTGDSLAQYITWDGIRALDYLASRPEVDTDRIGCSGASMGGRTTMNLCTVDPRLRAAMPVSAVTRSLNFIKQDVGRYRPGSDADHILVGGWSDGWEQADRLLPMALHEGYLRIGGNTKDYSPIESVRHTADEVKRLFAKLGLKDHISYFEAEHGHGWSEPMYRAVYQFFHDAFDESGPIEKHNVKGVFNAEGPARLDERLWSAKHGQVTAPPLNSVTALSLNSKKARRLAEERRNDLDPAQVIDAAVDLSNTQNVGLPDVDKRQAVQYHGYQVKKLILKPESGIELPALWVEPGSKAPSSRIAYVYGSPHGKQTVFDASHFPLKQVIHSGGTVLAVDTRGWGETRWRTKPSRPLRSYAHYTAPSMKSEENVLTYNALQLGTTLVGGRATDLLAAARWVQEQVGDQQNGNEPLIYLWGEGQIGVAAVHAVAASHDRRIEAVAVNSLYSYDDWARTKIYDVPVALIIPGILAEYDLPELSWALAKERGRPVVTWVNPVDAQDTRVPPAAVYGKMSEATPLSRGSVNRAIRIYTDPVDVTWQAIGTLTRPQRWVLDLDNADAQSK